MAFPEHASGNPSAKPRWFSPLVYMGWQMVNMTKVKLQKTT